MLYKSSEKPPLDFCARLNKGLIVLLHYVMYFNTMNKSNIAGNVVIICVNRM